MHAHSTLRAGRPRQQRQCVGGSKGGPASSDCARCSMVSRNPSGARRRRSSPSCSPVCAAAAPHDTNGGGAWQGGRAAEWGRTGQGGAGCAGWGSGAEGERLLWVGLRCRPAHGRGMRAQRGGGGGGGIFPTLALSARMTSFFSCSLISCPGGSRRSTRGMAAAAAAAATAPQRQPRRRWRLVPRRTGRRGASTRRRTAQAASHGGGGGAGKRCEGPRLVERRGAHRGVEVRAVVAHRVHVDCQRLQGAPCPHATR